MIIARSEITKRIEDSRKWVLVFGRRKTGKTFLVENTVSYDEYFFVNRNRTILNKLAHETIGFETFLEIFRRTIASEKTIVVDEFHRLGQEFLDIIHSSPKTGKVILITSTLYLAKKMLSTNSPMMGLLNEVRVDIISLFDTLKELSTRNLPNKELMEMAIIAREPLAIDYIKDGNSVTTIADILLGSSQSVPSLLGEIFTEEERTVSMVYNGIMGAIATGNISTGKISSFLFSRKLIQKDDPSIIQAYLVNLIRFGILKRIRILNKNKFAYKISSPLLRLYFCAQETLGISERQVSLKEITDLVATLVPRIVEDNVREIISFKDGLIETIIEDADYDVDGFLLKSEKPRIALEVKWRDHINDLRTIETKLRRISAPEHILFVPDKRGLKGEQITILDPSDLVG